MNVPRARGREEGLKGRASGSGRETGITEARRNKEERRRRRESGRRKKKCGGEGVVNIMECSD